MNALSSRDESIIRSIVEHCISIESRLQKFNITQEVFYNNTDYREMLLFPLVQIGELANHLSNECSANHSEIPWKDIVGLRHIIVHGYGTLDISWVWVTISNDIRPLHEACEAMLNNH